MGFVSCNLFFRLIGINSHERLNNIRRAWRWLLFITKRKGCCANRLLNKSIVNPIPFRYATVTQFCTLSCCAILTINVFLFEAMDTDWCFFHQLTFNTESTLRVNTSDICEKTQKRFCFLFVRVAFIVDFKKLGMTAKVINNICIAYNNGGVPWEKAA